MTHTPERPEDVSTDVKLQLAQHGETIARAVADQIKAYRERNIDALAVAFGEHMKACQSLMEMAKVDQDRLKQELDASRAECRRLNEENDGQHAAANRMTEMYHALEDRLATATAEVERLKRWAVDNPSALPELHRTLADERDQAEQRAKRMEEAMKDVFDFIDDGDSPCIGNIVQDDLVSNAYVNLCNLLEAVRENLTAPPTAGDADLIAPHHSGVHGNAPVGWSWLEERAAWIAMLRKRGFTVRLHQDADSEPTAGDDGTGVKA